MTNKQEGDLVERLEGLLREATAGPLIPASRETLLIKGDAPHNFRTRECFTFAPVGGRTIGGAWKREDAALIVALRNAAPGLIAAAKQLAIAREALADIRVFAQDMIDNGFLNAGALGNAYSIRDIVDNT